jgi:beta-xylosidase
LQAQTIKPVGTPGFTAGGVAYTKIAVDKFGTPYVAFLDYANGHKLSVMKYNGTSWVLVGPAGFSAQIETDFAIAVDNAGVPYVTYAEGSSFDNRIRVLKYVGGAWQTVGPGYIINTSGFEPTITFDNAGTPYVAFDDSSASVPMSISVMKYDGTSWAFVGVRGFNSQTSNHPQIVADKNNNLYVVFENYLVKPCVMKFDGTSWSNVGSPSISASGAGKPEITVDTSDNVYVIYQDYSVSPYSNATVMKFDGISWSTLGPKGFSSQGAGYPTIRADKNNNIYVNYVDGGNSNKAILQKYSGSAWMEVGATGGFSSGATDYANMVLDSHGNPYLVYSDGNTGGKATVMSYKANTNVPKKEAITEKIQMYPNPSNGTFFLRSTTECSFTLINETGQILQEGKLDNENHYTKQITGLKKGIYFVKSSNQSNACKLVVIY